MEAFNDKEFDQIFSARITEEIPAFEEESWLKMEQKLRKRDRAVFLRYASVVLVLLSFGLAIYLVQQKNKVDGEALAKHNRAAKPIIPAVIDTINRTGSPNPLASRPERYTAAILPKAVLNKTSPVGTAKPEVPQVAPSLTANPIRPQLHENVFAAIAPVLSQAIAMAQTGRSGLAHDEIPFTKINKKPGRKVPISLAFAVGPDFNSTTSPVGGKSSMAFGIGVGIGLTKKLSIQTGINYGHKKYDADAYNYTFDNPNVKKNTITEINAACEVIEIPFRASLNIADNPSNSIDVNAGLSSYLMLKEDYVYKYTAESGKSDRLLEAVNENQHILSVIDLSATYNIKLKNKKLALGIEPYVKIPLSGIGEGRVPLKSSGIALKLRYDFNKNK